MATDADYMRAAETPPKDRSDEQKRLVNDAHANGMTTVKNADHEARRKAQYGG